MAHGLALAYNNLGNALMAMEKQKEGCAQFLKAKEIVLALVHLKYGPAKELLGVVEERIRRFCSEHSSGG